MAEVFTAIDNLLAPTAELRRMMDEFARTAKLAEQIAAKMPKLPELPKLPPNIFADLSKLPTLQPIPRDLLANLPKLPTFELPSGFREMLAAMDRVRDRIHFDTVELPARARRAMETWAAHGWWLGPDMAANALFEVASALRDPDKVEQVHDELCDYYDEELDGIEAHLAERYPARAAILGDAFAAHREKRWALSIPVFLVQAEGITVDATGQKLYSRPGGIPALARFFANHWHPPYGAAIRYPLTVPTPLTALPAERAPDSTGLHRHPVLHGESVTYATRRNSARAVSLLAYIAWVFAPNDDDDGGREQ